MPRPLLYSLLSITLLLAWLALRPAKATLEVSQKAREIDLSKELGPYLGYGIGMHVGDLLYPEAFEELKPRFVRLEFGPDRTKLPESIPSGSSISELEQFIAGNYNADGYDRVLGAQTANSFFQQRNTQIIQILFEIPYQWRTEDAKSQLKTEHLEDLANFHTAHLRFLESLGVQPDYLELANEPDGFWNGYIAPTDYNHLVLRCAALFEQHLDRPPRILGPGLTFLNLHNWSPAYFKALEPEAVEALDGWSTHAWDEAEYQTSRPEYGYGVWQPFINHTQRLDPNGSKPVFVTEYASDVLQYGETTYTSPREQTTGTAVDSWPYAVRVVANSITHLNRGANALVLYRLTNSEWHETGWGIVETDEPPNFRAKPIYTALVEFFSDLPSKAKILSPEWYEHDDPITLSVFSEAGGILTLLLCNSTEQSHHKVLKLSMAYTEEIGKGMTAVGLFTPETHYNFASGAHTLEVSLPEQSIARITLRPATPPKALALDQGTDGNASY